MSTMTSDVFPREFGKYTLLGEIARGGMGIVFRAHQTDPKRNVALKVLRSDDPQQGERFLREVELAARLVHPSILPVFEVGEEDGHRFFTMELIEGKPLDSWLAEDVPPMSRKVEVLRDVARAVQHAHEQKVVHRDVKPSNILVDREGHAWVTDFGIAREMDVPSTLTGTGLAVGTPCYMSPEQALGDPARIDARCDVYGLGAVLYEALTGRPPFSGKTEVEIIEKVLHEDLTPPRDVAPEVPLDLERIVLKAMDKEPEVRYASAAEFADDLQRFLRGEPVLADPGGPLYRRWRRLKKNKPLAAALVVFAVLVVVGEVIFLTQYDRLHDEKAAIAQREAQRAEARNAYERGLLARGKAAVEAFTAAITADPSFTEALFERGKARIATGEYDKAVADLSQAISQQAEMAYAYYWRGVIRQDYFDRPEEARQDFEQAARLDPESDLGLLAQGALLEAQGKPAEAEERYSQAIERAPKSALGYQRRAKVRIGLGKIDDAVTDSRHALQIDPASAPALHNLAVALSQHGKFDEAIEALTKAIALNPRNPLHYHSRGVAKHQKKEFKAAIQDYSHAIALDPRQAMTFHCRARALYELGQLQDAFLDCKLAIAIAPDFCEPYAARGMIAFQRELYPNAIRDFEAFLKRAPEDHPGRAAVEALLDPARKRLSVEGDRRILVEEWIAQAEDAYMARDLDRAEGCYERALELDPRLGMAHYGLACVFARRFEPYREFRNFDMWDREKRRRTLDSALQHLAGAVQSKFRAAQDMADDPDLAPLKDDPRFARILRGEPFEKERQ